MAGLSPRDVYLGAVGGGTIIGLALSLLGAAMLFASMGTPAPASAVEAAVGGAAFLAVGGAFVLVSLIVLPALRAIRLESLEPKT